MLQTGLFLLLVWEYHLIAFASFVENLDANGF